MLKRMIVGATGFIGKRIVNQWLAEDIKVIVLGRSKEKIEKEFDQRVLAISWEEFPHQFPISTDDIEVVVNLAGANIADERWTRKRKDLILSSRITATEKIVSFCLNHNITLFNTSAVGIYGFQKGVKDGLPPVLDEDSNNFGDVQTSFLASVCRQWEAACQPMINSDIRCVLLRLGVVLDKKEGAYKKMEMPFHLFAGGPLGNGLQPVPWIAVEDVVNAINFLIQHKEISGPVNLTSPQCLTQKKLGKAIGKYLHRPSFIPTPGFILKVVLGEMADELLLNGQHVVPSKLNQANYPFLKPSIEDFLNS